MELTPDLLGNSLAALFITYFVVLAFQIYMIYLNWKQSKVKDEMGTLIKEVQEIKEILKQKKDAK